MEKEGCVLVKNKETVRLDIFGSLSLPIGIIDSGKVFYLVSIVFNVAYISISLILCKFYLRLSIFCFCQLALVCTY